MAAASDRVTLRRSRSALSMANQTSSLAEAPAEDDDTAAIYEQIDGDPASRYLILCDHATNHVPTRYGNLGLSAEELGRHIGYDIGAAAVTRGLARRLNATAIFAGYSRLLIDPNRGEHDESLILPISDGVPVPANQALTELDRAERIDTYYRPYHDAVEAAVDAKLAAGINPAIVSIHSFTPLFGGHRRPWHVGVLWDTDQTFAEALIAKLSEDPELVVGDNEPYTGKAPEYSTLQRHAARRGLPHVLVEIRQDLIAGDQGAEEWAERLALILADPALIEADR